MKPILDYCKVCGLPLERTQEDLEYHISICCCCGNQFGLDDMDVESAKEQRQIWLATGPVWWSKHSRAPKDWNPFEQMKNIPPEWL